MGFVQQALATFSEHPDTLHQPAVRKVLRDNLLLAMGTMLEEAQPMVSARERQPPELPPPAGAGARTCAGKQRGAVNRSRSVPAAVRQPSHLAERLPCDTGDWSYTPGSNGSALNAVRQGLISPWSERETVKEAAMQWGFWHLGQFATDYQQLFAEKPVDDAAPSPAPVGVREETPLPGGQPPSGRYNQSRT